MGLWDKLVNELIDIVEWTDDSRDTMVWRFQRYQNEIKYGAKLVVRESQVAAFVNEGRLADVYAPGTTTLTTQNMPVLTTLMGWKYGFNSPFKAEVYFVNTRMFTDRKWGTKNPILMRDPEFGMVRVRAFGTFAVRVKDPAMFLRQIVGTDQHFTIDEIGEQLRDLLVARFADVLAEMKLAVLDLAAHYMELGEQLRGRIQKDFDPMGLEVALLAIENISLPPEVEAAIDKRTSMGAIGDLGAYTRFQTAQAIGDAAKNPSGIAGVGAGLGAGMAMAGQMAGAMGQMNQAAPPIPQQTSFFVVIGGQQAGPFDMPALQQRIASGQLTAKTLVWRTGMAQWAPADSVQELIALFSQTQGPPTIPQP